MSSTEGTRIEGPAGAAQREQEKRTRDPLYRAAMRQAGCTVIVVRGGWVAVSPAGRALFGRLYPRGGQR